MARRPRTDDDEEILKEARERFIRCQEWEKDTRDRALRDTKFMEGDAWNGWQWDASVKQARGERPCLTMNKVRQHCLQIINDAREHKAQIKVTPTGGRATYEASKIFSGIIRRIEYQSKAVDAYSTAFFHQVQSGYGMLRVVTDYVDDDSFDQEIYVRRVPDPETVYLDPDAKDYDKADMRFAFVVNEIPRERYEAEFCKDAMPPSSDAMVIADASLKGWNDEHHIREAEYFRRTERSDKVHLLRDGSTVRESDLDGMDGDARKQLIASATQSRDLTTMDVEWFRIVGDRIEERKPWLGKYIPLVPVIGEETVIEQKLDRKGHVRALIDPQRIYNYWSSSAVEHVALQTKAPWVAGAQAVEGHSEWEIANVTNPSLLIYNERDEEGRDLRPPERPAPPVMAQAYIQGMSIARDDMLMVSGQYQAEFGQPSNERSGVAIDARQRQSDNATYHYVDNQAKSIRQVGRILLDLIPLVYDTQRVAKIMAEDGSDSDVHLNPDAGVAHQYIGQQPQGGLGPLTSQQYDAQLADPNTPNPIIIFDPNVGRYDVESDVGPAYGTQRQEAANAFAQIMAQNPAAFQLVGDFWAENSDFPGADELADRLKRGLPPQYKAGAPDPQVMQLQQQLQQTNQLAQQTLGKADAEIASLKQQLAALHVQQKDKTVSNATDDYDAETRRLQAVAAADPAAAQVIIRSLLSGMLGMPALPIMAAHAEAEQAMRPDPARTNGDAQSAS